MEVAFTVTITSVTLWKVSMHHRIGIEWLSLPSFKTQHCKQWMQVISKWVACESVSNAHLWAVLYTNGARKSMSECQLKQIYPDIKT